MNTAGLVAVSNLTGPCGATTWWRLSGGLRVVELVDELEQANLPRALYPENPSPLVTLKKAMDMFTLGHAIVKPLDSGDGYALLVRGKDARGKPEYTTAWTARLDGKGIAADGMEESDAQMLFAYFEKLAGQMDTNATGTWLSFVVQKHCDGLRLRDSGGIYYVPEHRVPLLQQVAGSLRAVSKSIVEFLPTMKTQQAAEAILRAVTDDCNATATLLSEEITKYVNDRNAGVKVRPSTLDKRRSVVAEAEAKLERYESVLDVRLDDLRATLAKVQTAIVTAALAA